MSILEGANGIMYNGIFIPLEKIGTDVSDTTATAEDVLEGKQFYNAEGSWTQGTYVPAPVGGSTEYFKCVAVGEKAEEGGSGGSTDRQYTDYYYMEFTPSQDAIDDGIAIVEDVTGLYWGNLAESKVLTNAHGSTIYLNDEGYQWQVRSHSRGDMYFWNWVDSGDPGWGSTEKPGTKFTGNVGAAIGDEHETVFYTLSVATDEQINAGSSAGDSSSSGNSTDIVVSGIDSSGQDYFLNLNQEYYQYNADATGNARIWISKNTFDGNGNTYYGKIYKYDGSGDWRLVVVNNPDANSYYGQVALLSGSNTDPIGTWNGWNDYNGNPAVTEWASAEPELAPNTWNGQKAIRMTDAETGKPYYDFEETVTEGLTFGNGFTPIVDGIYDREAMVKVNLFEKVKIPQEGLVLKADLTSGLESTVELSGLPEFKEINGRQCAYTNGATAIYSESFNAGNEFTVSFGVFIEVLAPIFSAGPWDTYSGVELLAVSDSVGIYMRTGASDSPISCNTNVKNAWHHFILTYKDSVATLYIDNVEVQKLSKSGFNIGNGIALGTNFKSGGGINRDGYSTAGYQLWRVYNRVLTDDERTLLYQEFAK